MTERVDRFGIMTISALIVAILGVQAVVSFCKCTGRAGWPMVSYPMYSGAHYDGDRVHHDYELYAALDDGQRIKLSREDLGMGSPAEHTARTRSFWMFQKNVVYPMLRAQPEKLQPIVERLCSQELLLTRLEIYDFGVAVDRNGAVHGLAPELVVAVDAVCR